MIEDFRKNGNFSQIAEQLNKHDKLITKLLARVIPVSSATKSFLLPFTPYTATLPMPLTVTANPFSASIDRNFTLVQWGQGFWVSTTNNASHYWTIRIERINDSAVVNTFDTSSYSPDGWRINIDTTFAIGSLVSTDVGIRIACVKNGSPGSLYLLGPILEATA